MIADAASHPGGSAGLPGCSGAVAAGGRPRAGRPTGGIQR
jgi:hypothetical protein